MSFLAPQPHACACRIPSRYALDRAKKRVEKFYAVVGVTERMTDFFTVLEYIFPHYFTGATQYYRQHCKCECTCTCSVGPCLLRQVAVTYQISSAFVLKDVDEGACKYSCFGGF